MIADATESPHMHQALVIFFGWARGRALIEKNLMENLKPPGKFKRRTRILAPEELQKIWTATKDIGNYGNVVRLCLLTIQRKEQLIASKITNQLLTYTTEDTKNKQDIAIPLTDIAAKYFPLTPITNWSRPKANLNTAVNFSNWQLRDLRRTGSTLMAQIGIAPHLIELLLNHVSPKALGGPVGVTYNIYRYLPEMRIALEDYQRHLETIGLEL